jgi:NodT family efflux transporter outer membrane factor (OMF) lipoprotein
VIPQTSVCLSLLLLGASAVMSGCVLPPKELSHPAELSNRDAGLAGAAVEPVADGWWSSFQDPQLDRLIRAGLQNSPTLAQARSRVAEAVARTQALQSKLLPNVDYAAGVSYQRAPENYLIPPPLAGHSFWSGQAGVSLDWDLDFRGRQKDAVRSAQALAQSARFDADNARLILAGAIAQAYIELYRQYALAAIAERSAEQRADIVAITRRRVTAGLDTQLELRQAEGQLPQARAAREQAQAAADLAVHALAVLTASSADSYALIVPPSISEDAALPVPNTLPINLLARRPDVLSARFYVTAADAQRRADKAAFYPDVNLKGLAGFAAFGLNNLVNWSARGYEVGPAISLPLFDAGRLRAEYTGSEAQLDSAIDVYNDTVLRAVQQTADQLTLIDALARERLDQQETLTANEAAYKLAEERYRAGLASYLSVLNAETQVLIARQTVVDIRAGQVMARVNLLLAVGGSFDPEEADHVSTRLSK